MTNESKLSTSPIPPPSLYPFKMKTLSIVACFPTDPLLVMAGVLSAAVVIGMVGGVGDIDGKRRTAVTTGAAIVG